MTATIVKASVTIDFEFDPKGDPRAQAAATAAFIDGLNRLKRDSGYDANGVRVTDIRVTSVVSETA